MFPRVSRFKRVSDIKKMTTQRLGVSLAIVLIFDRTKLKKTLREYLKGDLHIV